MTPNVTCVFCATLLCVFFTSSAAFKLDFTPGARSRDKNEGFDVKNRITKEMGFFEPVKRTLEANEFEERSNYALSEGTFNFLHSNTCPLRIKA